MCQSLNDQSSSRSTKPKPITIRGVTYPSLSKAAQALGVSRGSLYTARRNGWVERIGLRPGRLLRDAHPISVDLPADQLAELDAYAKKEQISRAAAIRELIEFGLEVVNEGKER